MEKQISLGNKNLISVSTHTQACSALLLSFSKTRVIHLCRFCYFAISCWLFCNGTKMEAGPGVASAPCKAHTKLALSCGLWGLRRGDCPALRSAGAHTASPDTSTLTGLWMRLPPHLSCLLVTTSLSGPLHFVPLSVWLHSDFFFLFFLQHSVYFNSQKLQTTKISINRWTDKQMMVEFYNRIVLKNKMEINYW